MYRIPNSRQNTRYIFTVTYNEHIAYKPGSGDAVVTRQGNLSATRTQRREEKVPGHHVSLGVPNRAIMDSLQATTLSAFFTHHHPA